MDQHGKGETWQQTKTSYTNIEKPTYLTKYEQFIANLLPKPYPVENMLNTQQQCVSQNMETKQTNVSQNKETNQTNVSQNKETNQTQVSQNIETRQAYVLQNINTEHTYVLRNIETNKSISSPPKYVLPLELISNNHLTTNGGPYILQSILKKPCPTPHASKKPHITSDVLIKKSADSHSAVVLKSKTSPTSESVSNSSESHRKRPLIDGATNHDPVSYLITVPPEAGNISAEQPIAILQEEPMKAYECKVCSFETIYESSFKEHILTHRKTRKVTFHKCPKCPFRIRCRASVRKHMVAHKKSPTEIVYCGLHAYSSKCKVDLDLHLHEHSST